MLGWIAVAVVILALIGVGVYFWIQRRNKAAEDAEAAEEGEKPIAQIIYFYTPWCPYCKKARPEWDKFKSKWNKQSLDGVTIVVTDVDCEADEPTANKYDITGYPTVKCVLNKKVAEFEGTIDAEALELFLRTCIES